MELKQLRYFEVVARGGSLSRASASLGVSQSMLTRHIQSLEQELGISLLYRNGHGMVLTDNGKQFLTTATDILHRSDTAVQQMQALRSVPGGTVTMGVPPMLGEFLVVPLTKRFRAELPNVQLVLREAVSGYLQEWLLTGKLDIGVLYNANALHTVAIEPLLSDEMWLIGAPDAMTAEESKTSISLVDAVKLPWILPPKPHGLRMLAEGAVAERSLMLNLAVEVESMVSIFDLVEASQGYSIAPYAAIRRRTERGSLRARPITNPTLSGVLSIAFSPKKEATLAMKALYRIVRQETEALVRTGVWRATA